MKTLLFVVSLFLVGIVTLISTADAKPLNRAEIARAMLGKTISTRRFGLSVIMRYRRNGTVSAKALLGTVNGTWRYRGSNQVCTTFPSGPAKGTSCVSFTKTGPNQFRSSEGVNFRVGG